MSVKSICKYFIRFEITDDVFSLLLKVLFVFNNLKILTDTYGLYISWETHVIKLAIAPMLILESKIVFIQRICCTHVFTLRAKFQVQRIEYTTIIFKTDLNK